MLPIPGRPSYSAPNHAGVNATVPVLATTALGLGTNADQSVVPAGTGAFQLCIPDGTTVGGNKRGANAIDLQGPSQRTSAAQVASGATAVAIGASNQASGAQAVAIGNGNVASSSATVALGDQATASANYALALGQVNTASATYSVSIGSYSVCNGVNAITLGVNAYTNALTGQLTLGSGAGTSVISQWSLLQLRAVTTTTAATVLTANASTAATTNQLTLRNNSAVRVKILAIARDETNNTDAKEWTGDALITRGSTAASTAFVGSDTLTSTFATSGASGWTLALSIDTTNGALQITATSSTTDSVRWHVKLEFVEVS
jgi:hypothetical protein